MTSHPKSYRVWVAMVCAASSFAAATAARGSAWIGASGGLWSAPGSWSPSGTPSGAAATAVISLSPASPFTVNMDFTYASAISSVTLNSSTNFDLTVSQPTAGSSLLAGTETIGDTGSATYKQSAGNNGSTTLILGSSAAAVGNYSLSGGTFSAKTLTVGASGTGIFSHTGGNATIGDAVLHNGTFTIAQNALSTSSFTLASNAALTVNGSETVGSSGNGSFTQTGGTHTLNGPAGGITLMLGSADGSTGTYTQSGGVFNDNALGGIEEFVGYFGTGVYNQTGGTHTIGTPWFTIGWGGTGHGTYNLSKSATLTVSAIEWIGYLGTGTFNQTGGTHTIGSAAASSTLIVGDQPGSSGSYTLSGAASQLNVFGGEFFGNASGSPGASGSFTQTGGSHTVTQTIELGNGTGATGTYSFSGGTLVAGGMYVGASGNGTYNQTGGNTTSGNWVTNAIGFVVALNASSTSTATLDAGGSLTAYIGESIGNAGNGTFNQLGGTNIIVTTNPGGSGTNGGLIVGNLAGSIGTYNQSGGTFVDGSGATAAFTEEFVGNSGTGTYNQSGGSHTINLMAFTVGWAPGGVGTYNLSNAATLTVNATEWVGDQGLGTFNQTGGTHVIGSAAAPRDLYIGDGGSGHGNYTLSGASSQLNVSGNETIGNQGLGLFTQSDGSHTAETLTLGGSLEGSGTYNLSGGSLNIAAYVRDGNNIPGVSGISGQFNHSGGSFNVGGQLTIGSLANSVGVYSFSGSASLSVTHGLIVGDGGDGTFTQSSGTSTVAGTGIEGLIIANGPGSTGTYTLGGGSLSVTADHGEVVGYQGVGTFTQTNGANSITSALRIAQTGISTGTYNLQGGTLTVPAIQVYRGGAFNFSGGSLGGPSSTNATLTNAGVFTYTGGTFTGRLINQAVANILNDFAPANGIENDANLLLNQLTLSFGQGLTNFGTLTLDGGNLNGPAPVVNDFGGVMNARGTLSAPFTNNGTLNLTGLLIASIGNTNAGAINLPPASVFRGNLANTGQINLSGGSVTGTVENDAGGRIQGGGAISGTLTNNAGGLVVSTSPSLSLTLTSLAANAAGAQIEVQENTTINLLIPVTNAGLISLGGDHALLAAPSITNAGTIRGQGQVASTIINSSVLRAEGGQLTLSAAGSNSAAGQIQAPSGGTIFYSSGLTANAGTIALSGGAFDNNNHPLANSGTISGAGIFRSGGLTNNATIDVADGPTSFYGAVTNAGMLKITANTTTFFGPVNNNAGATIKTTSATARFLDSFTNAGAYLSDPADNYFQDLLIDPQGYLAGGLDDRFIVAGDLLSSSSQSKLWDTRRAELIFRGGTIHHLELAARDLGPSDAGYSDNFAFGGIDLGAGESLVLDDASAGGSNAVYVEVFQLEGGLAQLSLIEDNGQSIYYDSNNPANAYLSGQSYALINGGALAPVPEPLTLPPVLLAAWLLHRRRGLRPGPACRPNHAPNVSTLWM